MLYGMLGFSSLIAALSLEQSVRVPVLREESGRQEHLSHCGEDSATRHEMIPRGTTTDVFGWLIGSGCPRFCVVLFVPAV